VVFYFSINCLVQTGHAKNVLHCHKNNKGHQLLPKGQSAAALSKTGLVWKLKLPAVVIAATALYQTKPLPRHHVLLWEKPFSALMLKKGAL